MKEIIDDRVVFILFKASPVYLFVQTGLGPTQPTVKLAPSLFPGVNLLGRRVDHPPPSTAEVKEIVEIYFHSPCRYSWLVIG